MGFGKILGCGQVIWMVKLAKVGWGRRMEAIFTISTKFLLSHGKFFCCGNRSPKPCSVCHDGCFRLAQCRMGISIVTGYVLHVTVDLMCV